MSVHVLGDGRDGGPLGVLVDDAVAGRLLLDCGTGVATRAAFAGLSLAGVRVLPTGAGPVHLDPAVPAAAVVASWPGARVLPGGDGRCVVLLDTSWGTLVHAAPDVTLLPATVAALPGEVVATLPHRSAGWPAGVTLRDRPPGRRVLVTGGSRSGKSAFAEARLAGRADVTYLATGPAPDPADAEWAARVQAHRARRPAGWATAETPGAAAVLRAGGGPVLLDAVGTWLAAAMDAAGTWDGRGDAALGAAVDALVGAWAATARDVVAVTDEVGSGVVPATPAGRRFRDELGRLNARLAAAADEVWLCTVGVGQRLR